MLFIRGMFIQASKYAPTLLQRQLADSNWSCKITNYSPKKGSIAEEVWAKNYLPKG